MGTTHPKSNDTIQFKRTIHPHLQAAMLLEIDNQLILQNNEIVHNEEQFQKWKMDRLQINNSSKFLMLPSGIDSQITNYCSGFKSCKLYHEFYPYCFDKEMEFRSKTRANFLEKQLWYLLYAGITVCSEFEMLNRPLGVIHPRNIIMNSKGLIKFVNVYSWPSQNPFREQLSYMSPEEIANQKMYDIHKSNIFSLGLILLESAILKQMKYLSSGKIDIPLLEDYIKQLRMLEYSQFLKKTIILMVELDPNRRMRPSKFVKVLKQYQKQILQFQPF